MTKYEVLLCMYQFLDKEYFSDKNKSFEYIYYISNINPGIWEDEGTADPAYYDDYLTICSSFFKEDECSLQDGLEYAKKYLDEYNLYEQKRFASNIDEVVAVFSKCTLSDWEKIYERIRSQRSR